MIVPLAAGLDALARCSPRPAWRGAAAAGLLAVLGALTLRQSATYDNAERLYETTLARNPACW